MVEGSSPRAKCISVNPRKVKGRICGHKSTVACLVFQFKTFFRLYGSIKGELTEQNNSLDLELYLRHFTKNPFKKTPLDFEPREPEV